MAVAENFIKPLLSLLPVLSTDQKLLAKEIYQRLLEGKPLNIKSLVNLKGRTPAVTSSTIDGLDNVEFNRDGDIKAYRGLTMDSSIHQISIDDYKVFAWCAFDTLFLFQLIKSKSKQIESICPSCKKTITLTEFNFKTTHALMSFKMPGKTCYENDLKKSFCCHVNFYCDSDCKPLSPGLGLKFIQIEEAMKAAKERNRLYLNL